MIVGSFCVVTNGATYEGAWKRSICKNYSRGCFFLTTVDFYVISCGTLTHFSFPFSFCYIEGAYRVRGGRRNERKVSGFPLWFFLSLVFYFFSVDLISSLWI